MGLDNEDGRGETLNFISQMVKHSSGRGLEWFLSMERLLVIQFAGRIFEARFFAILW